MLPSSPRDKISQPAIISEIYKNLRYFGIRRFFRCHSCFGKPDGNGLLIGISIDETFVAAQSVYKKPTMYSVNILLKQLHSNQVENSCLSCLNLPNLAFLGRTISGVFCIIKHNQAIPKMLKESFR